MKVVKLLRPDRYASKLFNPTMLHLLSDGFLILLVETSSERVIHPLQEDALCSAEEALDKVWMRSRGKDFVHLLFIFDVLYGIVF